MRHIKSLAVVLSTLATPLLAQTSLVSSTSFDGAVTCFDQTRHRLVMALPSRAIWEWDGTYWGQASVALPAAPRAAVYDPAQGRVLFHTTSNLVAYDGHAAQTIAAMPDADTYCFAFDTHRNRLQAIRSGLGGALAQELVGSTWTPLGQPGTLQVSLGLAYDEARRVLVTTTTDVTTTPFLHHTWEWNGTTWALRASQAQPQLRLAYDPVRQQVIAADTTTKAWDGVTWTLLPTTVSPRVTICSADPARGVLWGYERGATIWTWNGLDWSAALTTPHPAVSAHGFTFDPLRSRAVLLGNDSGNALVHHEWDGIRWHDLTPSTGPQLPRAASQTFDLARGETLLFGGYYTNQPGQSVLSGDTWTWNGTSWRLAATTGPSPRRGAAITFDSLRNRTVLLGGLQGSTFLNDHWEWDGTTWSQIAATTPMGQTRMALGFDPIRNRLVALDGDGNTWEHLASGWLLVAGGPLTPAPGSQLVWDDARQRLQGNLGSGTALAHREWDGMSWTPRTSYSGFLAYDLARDVTLGYRTTALTTLTAQPASTADVGLPCGGSQTVTSLTTFGGAQPGNQGFHLDVRAEAVSSPTVLGLALATTNVSLGNQCTLYLQNPIGSLFTATDAHGFLHQPLGLPGSGSLRGVVVYAQAAVFDPASAGSLAMTQGLRVTLGD